MNIIGKRLFPNKNIESIIPLFLYFLIIRIFLTNEYLQRIIGYDIVNTNGGVINSKYFKLSQADLLIPFSISVFSYIFLIRFKLKVFPSVFLITLSYFLSNLLAILFFNGEIDSYSIEVSFFNSISLLLFFVFLYQLIFHKWFNVVSFGVIFFLSERLVGFIFYDLHLLFGSVDYSFSLSSLFFDLIKITEGIIAALIFKLVYDKM